MFKCEVPTTSTREVSSAFGKAGLSKKALGGLKVRFTSVEENILTLHGLVRRAEVQLEEAMRELRKLEVSLE